jgi:8-oxo-dGTP diphosphatase
MIKVAAGLVFRSGKILVCQRRPTAHYPLQWEFPGGKVEAGETIAECLARELHEELSIRAVVGKEFHHQQWNYPDSGVFDIYYCFVDSYTGEPVNNVFEQIQWIEKQELPRLNMLEGNRDVVARLAALA